METIQCNKCGAVFEKTGVKDKLRRFKDKRFMKTFHCPNCDARVILKNGEEPITIYLKRLERLKEQARRLGDRQEVNELQDEIDQINREIKMDAGKTKDKKFSMKGNDAYDPTKPKNIAAAKTLAKAQGAAASDKDEAYDPTDPENIEKEKELAKARGAAAADKKTKDSLFKGQKVTAIKSEQGLREGETYTVLGEEAIIKQIVGENDAIVYKLQDSSGNVIVIENPEGLFYEVKDDAPDNLPADYVDNLRKKISSLISQGNKEAAKRLLSEFDDLASSIDPDKAAFHKALDADPDEENESLKVKIGDIKKNMDAARKMGYDTEPYQKEIDKLGTKDDKEFKEMLVNDAPDYYGAIVATARRGNNPQMGSKEVRKNLEPFMASHGVQFNEEEFNKAYKEFNRAGVSKAAFMKGTDADDFYTKDPLTKKGEKILAAMKKAYGEEKGEQIFYASKNKGTISGVDKKTKDARTVCKECGKSYDPDKSDVHDPDNSDEFCSSQCEAAYRAGEAEHRMSKDNYREELQKLHDQLEEAKEEGDKSKVRDLEIEIADFIKETADSKTKDNLYWKIIDLKSEVSRIKSQLYNNNVTLSIRGNPLTPEQKQWWKEQVDKMKEINERIKVLEDKAKDLKAKGINPADVKDADYKIRECPNCKNQLTYAGEENGKIKYECGLCGKKFVSKDAKTKDQEIKIIIGDDPVNPGPAEQKVEGNGDI